MCVFSNSSYRHDSDSDTAVTDEEHKWHGSGKFEYSRKGLPHAVFHYTEMLVRGGHHAAYCTSGVESGHKKYIKKAAIYTRTLTSHNQTQDGMLTWVLRQKLFHAVIHIAKQDQVHHNNDGIADDPDSPPTTSGILIKWKHTCVV